MCEQVCIRNSANFINGQLMSHLNLVCRVELSQVFFCFFLSTGPSLNENENNGQIIDFKMHLSVELDCSEQLLRKVILNFVSRLTTKPSKD